MFDSPPSALPARPSWIDGVGEAYAEFVRSLRKRTGNADEARELAHDTWLRLAEQGCADRARSPGYAHTVADHLAIDHVRHRQRGQERFTQVEPEEAARLAVAPDVATVHTHREALGAVDAALQAMPKRSRAIFLADRLDGTSHQELARQHGVSIKTVEREVMRGLDTVETALRRWRGEADTRPHRGRRRALCSLLGTAGASVGTLAAWQAWRQWVPEFGTVMATATGSVISRLLPDGSKLTLDAASRAEVRYFPSRRTARLLAGSAFFAVAREPERPFVVIAGGHTVQVLGTRFEVALQTDGGLQVAVESGRVLVRSAAGEEQVLNDGQRVMIDGSQGMSVRTGTGGPVAPWREGWLDFRHVRLDEAVARLGRYVGRPLRVSPDAAGLEVFGRVHTADSLAWLRLLPASLPVRVQDDSRDGALVLSHR
jgi:RNA polymerase sigma factor (sigma-70 family)